MRRARRRGLVSRAWLVVVIALMLVFVWTSMWEFLMTAGVLTLFRAVQLVSLEYEDTFQGVEHEYTQAQVRALEMEMELNQLREWKKSFCEGDDDGA